MELIERDDFLTLMLKNFDEVTVGEGHCILIAGEAGIGKTSLAKAFCKSVEHRCEVYLGTCDALFIPRPLGPVLDIIWQLPGVNWTDTLNTNDKSALFTRFLHELANKVKPTIVVFEDIHWADEATLDFIKFLARRISRLHCLFILTYRDDEVHIQHPLRNVLGQLPSDSFTRLQLTPLSLKGVEELSAARGYNGEEVFAISGGNPFYVHEILASYSIGVPDNIRDSVLSSYKRLDEKTREIWEILSVLPTGLEIKYLDKLEPCYSQAIHNCVDLKILVTKGELIFFKHELYRRTIESSLSPLVRISWNKRILELLQKKFEENGELERIVHHAKNANENEIVVKYAPLAGKQAATVGAHFEAARFYLTAIEYYQGNDNDILLQFYQSYAYECYLTNQIREAIIYGTKAHNILMASNDTEKKGNCLRFLSRFWWFNGNGQKAEDYAKQAVEMLADQPVSRTKAMAYSSMSQLKMLADEREECIEWGEKAIQMAKEVNDEEALSHALNNVGTVLMRVHSSRQKGISLLQQSLAIALNNSYEDQVVRAYINLGSNAVVMRDYEVAKRNLELGTLYCEERDIDYGRPYLLVFKARMFVDIGLMNEALAIVTELLKNENQPPIIKIGALVIAATVKMRKGENDILPALLEAKEKAFVTREPQRVLPVLVACLEYEWITGNAFVDDSSISYTISLIENAGNIFDKSQFAFWLLKARNQEISLKESFEGFHVDSEKTALKASALWKQLGCPYEQALTLFYGSETHKRMAIDIVDKLGASAVYEKMKFEMRASGIKSIPRGIRKSTKANPANLTDREMGILHLLKDGLQNKEIASRLFISPKTVDHHISSIFFKLDVNSRTKAVQEAARLEIIRNGD